MKIKVSYERPEELQHILERLRPDVKSWRKSGNREGQYMKAYIYLDEQRVNHEK
ncbi:hypothetical protein [Clostridium sp. FS41]|uniref:hypothetical protein n=1 Tax=Clostridium sp. FS41 TaxID=1609975 RepID=UPI000AA4AD19|nr:hypothetical protein [Clostridium sp. FS41]